MAEILIKHGARPGRKCNSGEKSGVSLSSEKRKLLTKQWDLRSYKVSIDVKALLVKSETSWVDDNEKRNCQLCSDSFSLFRRRHHCRKCGALVCNDCSRKEIADSRICDCCFNCLANESEILLNLHNEPIGAILPAVTQPSQLQTENSSLPPNESRSDEDFELSDEPPPDDFSD